MVQTLEVDGGEDEEDEEKKFGEISKRRKPGLQSKIECDTYRIISLMLRLMNNGLNIV